MKNTERSNTSFVVLVTFAVLTTCISLIVAAEELIPWAVGFFAVGCLLVSEAFRRHRPTMRRTIDRKRSDAERDGRAEKRARKLGVSAEWGTVRGQMTGLLSGVGVFVPAALTAISVSAEGYLLALGGTVVTLCMAWVGWRANRRYYLAIEAVAAEPGRLGAEAGLGAVDRRFALVLAIVLLAMSGLLTVLALVIGDVQQAGVLGAGLLVVGIGTFLAFGRRRNRYTDTEPPR